MNRDTLIAPTSTQWAEQIADAKALDSYATIIHGQRDHSHHLCAVQRQQQRDGYMMVEVSTNIFGYCVRDTMNDGMGVLFGGRARPGTTKAEAIAWAADWHAQRPTHREVIQGFESKAAA